MRLPFLLAAGVFNALAQSDPGVLLRQTFESETGGWQALGPEATVSVARVPSDTGRQHNRTNALAIRYQILPKQVSGAYLPALPAFAHMQSLRFWARSDYDTAIGVVLAEKTPGGGRYTAWAWSPANTWQEIDLAPGDFIANDGPQDPVDADGKLDLDALQNLALIDLGQFFAAAPQEGPVPVAIDRPSGAHTLLIDDFELLSKPLPAAPKGQPAGAIDRFDRGFLQWITLGGMKLRRAAESPLGGPALEASYEQTEGTLQVLVRRIGAAASGPGMSHARRITFDLASLHEAVLVVSLEMKNPGAPNGPRFHMTVYPPGNREVFHVDLKLADFDGPGNLDPAKIKTLALTDITAGAGGVGQANTIWIGNLAMPEQAPR